MQILLNLFFAVAKRLENPVRFIFRHLVLHLRLPCLILLRLLVLLLLVLLLLLLLLLLLFLMLVLLLILVLLVLLILLLLFVLLLLLHSIESELQVVPGILVVWIEGKCPFVRLDTFGKFVRLKQ